MDTIILALTEAGVGLKQGVRSLGSPLNYRYHCLEKPMSSFYVCAKKRQCN